MMKLFQTCLITVNNDHIAKLTETVKALMNASKKQTAAQAFIYVTVACNFFSA